MSLSVKVTSQTLVSTQYRAACFYQQRDAGGGVMHPCARTFGSAMNNHWITALVRPICSPMEKTTFLQTDEYILSFSKEHLHVTFLVVQLIDLQREILSQLHRKGSFFGRDYFRQHCWLNSCVISFCCLHFSRMLHLRSLIRASWKQSCRVHARPKPIGRHNSIRCALDETLVQKQFLSSFFSFRCSGNLVLVSFWV